MEGFQPSFMEEVDNFESLLSELEFHSSPPEVPVNQSSISCNDQGGQNNVINNSIQQTTPFPTSFPETMMEGFQPSSMDDDLFDLQSPLLSPAPEVPVNQDSISCNDQGGQNNAINDSIQQTTQFPTSFPETMTGHRYMTQNATTSQHGEFNQPGPSSPAPCKLSTFAIVNIFSTTLSFSQPLSTTLSLLFDHHHFSSSCQGSPIKTETGECREE